MLDNRMAVGLEIVMRATLMNATSTTTTTTTTTIAARSASVSSGGGGSANKRKEFHTYIRRAKKRLKRFWLIE